MLPLRDDNPTRTTPVITFLLIALNVAAFIYQWAVIGLDKSSLLYGVIPAELTGAPVDMEVLRKMRLPAQLLQYNLDPAWATVFTSMFMHGSLMHIGGNMLWLWIFGNNVEDAMGKVKFLVFYLATGAAAAMAQVMLNPGSPVPMVGASGAVAGVLGAYLVLFPGSRVLCLTMIFIITTIELPASIVLGVWFLLELFRGLGSLAVQQVGGVAYAAHVGGFAAGWLLVRIFAPARRRARRFEARDHPSDYVDWR